MNQQQATKASIPATTATAEINDKDDGSIVLPQEYHGGVQRQPLVE
jgi:hypothetical protein